MKAVSPQNGNRVSTAHQVGAVYELPVFTWETVWEPAAKEGKHTEAQLSNWPVLQFISEK